MNLNTSAAFVRSFKIKYGSTGEVRIAARTPSRPSGQSEALTVQIGRCRGRNSIVAALRSQMQQNAWAENACGRGEGAPCLVPPIYPDADPASEALGQVLRLHRAMERLDAQPHQLTTEPIA